MLRLFCRQATFILMFSIGNRAYKLDPNKYVPFLSDIQDYYKSSGIFFLYDDTSDSEKKQIFHSIFLSVLLTNKTRFKKIYILQT